jgi:hypothetical protein
VETDPRAAEVNEQPPEEPAPRRTDRSNLALTLALISLLLWFGFQAFQMIRERGNLSLVRASQDTAMQESEKIRAQFQSLLSKLSDLANKGHPGAKMIIEELQNRGAAQDGVSPQARPGE